MKTVSKSQLKQWVDQKQDLLLIDVLPKDNFNKQHLPGAINIPFKDNANFTQEVEQRAQSKNQCIVVYCLNTECSLSKEAAQQLETSGFTNVQAFEDGVEGWFGKSMGQAAA